jgi:cell division protein FtsB
MDKETTKITPESDEVTVRVDTPEKKPLTPQELEELETHRKLAQLEGIEPMGSPEVDPVAARPAVENDGVKTNTLPPAADPIPVEEPNSEARTEALLLQARQKAQENSRASKKGGAAKIMAWVFGFLLLLALGAAGYFYWQYTSQQQAAAAAQQTVSTQQPKIAALQSEVDQLKKSTAAAQPATPAPTQSAAVKYREIPEWGVRYKVTEANKNLTYTYSMRDAGSVRGVSMLSFSTTDVTAIRSASPDANGGSYPCTSAMGQSGLITRFSQPQYTAAQKEDPTLSNGVTKIGDYYYLAVPPQQNGCVGLDNAKAKALSDVVIGLPKQFEVSS